MSAFSKCKVITTYRGELTEDKARYLLSKNKTNRKLSNSRAAKYATDIISGSWADIGGAIVLDQQDNILDGQHRCEAVLIAKQSIPVTYVILETAEGALSLPFDIHSKRSTADITGLSKDEAAIFSFLVYDLCGDKIVESGVANMIKKHPDWVDWVRSHIENKRHGAIVGNAGIRAGVLVASLKGVDFSAKYNALAKLDMQEKIVNDLYKRFVEIKNSGCSISLLRKKMFCVTYDAAINNCVRQRITQRMIDDVMGEAKKMVISGLWKQD